MKITPLKYAQALVQSMKEGKDPKSLVKNLLSILRQKKQFRLLPKIVQTFEIEWNKKQGIVKIEVTYPEKFESSLAELEKKIAEKTTKQLDIRAKKSEALIGGFRVCIDGTLIDASLETRLNELKTKLAGAR